MSLTSDSERLGALDQYFDSLAAHNLIEDREEEREIARRARAGNREAAQKLVEANLRFVISYVKKYRGYGLSLAELVSVGNVGLLKAVRKYDPDRGVKFISYAVWWVRQTVLKALAEEGGSVRLPQSRNSQLYQISQAEQKLTQELGRSPTDGEVAEELDERMEKIRLLRKVGQSEVRFDAPLDETERDSATLYERYAHDEQEDLTEDIERRSRREFLEEMFAKYLTDRERKILVLYYGLDDGGEHTLEEVGELMGVTRERIRQLRNRASDKLRGSEHGEALKGLWRERRAS